MEKKVFNGILVVFMVLISVFGAWKIQGGDFVRNQKTDILAFENALALGESQPVLKFIAWHKVYKVTQEKICDVYDEKDKGKCIGMIVKFHLNTGKWQTCDNTSDPKYKTNCHQGACTSEACAIACGYQVKEPTGVEFDTPVFIAK